METLPCNGNSLDWERIVLYKFLKVLEAKEKNRKTSLQQLEILHTTQETTNRMKKQPKQCEKLFAK